MPTDTSQSADSNSTELATLEEQELALIKATQGDLADGEIVIPILKVGQALSKEVAAKEQESGDIYNSLTGENFGTSVEFIVCGFHKGRFKSDRDTGEGRSYPFNGTCPCHGQSFLDCPNAEEQYKAAVNRGEKEWDKGPAISTTFNFTGYVVGSDMPVRLSLMRAAKKTAQKINTILRFQRAPWDRTVNISTFSAMSKRKEPYTGVNATQGRPTTPEERQAAVALAQAVQQQRVEYQQDEASEGRSEAPAPSDGIEF